jgi:branched-chain amino acid transport system substrate-binding protein
VIPAPPPASAAQQNPLTVYASFPLQGAARPQSEDVVRGIRLAFKRHGFEAGGQALRLVVLDDSTAAEGKWDAAQTKANARKAAGDDSTIAYIGEFNSGATANSLPTLNEAGILQVSPSNEARGLTKDGPGADPGEPDRYYPTGARTYGRVIPIDDVQAAALVNLMKRRRAHRVFVLDDKEIYGRGVAVLARRAARRAGIRVVGTEGWDGRAANYLRLAARIRRTHPDAVLAAGIVDNNAPRLFEDLHRTMPRTRLYGPDGVATVDFARELGAGTQRRTTLTAPAVAPSALPKAGRAFWRRFRAEYHKPVAKTDPYALYGYAAADAVLHAIDGGGASRRAVVRAFFATRRFPSVLGRYSVQPSGDTSVRLYGAYRVHHGRLVFARAVRPS